MSSLFYSEQFNQSLFFPGKRFSLCPAGAEDYILEVEQDVLIHIRAHYPLKEKPWISLFYFHGNGEVVSDYDEEAGMLTEMTRCQFIVVDYRGYGLSTGRPTLPGILSDSRLVYQKLREAGKLLDKTVVMGRSLGSGCAVELCANIAEISGCILESGYAEALGILERRGLNVTEISEQDQAMFNNFQKIRNVHCPLLVMHGEKDMLILPEEANMNYDNAGSTDKNLVLLEGVGHNNIMASPLYFPTLCEFLAKFQNM